jgi:predicted secreted protein
MKNLHLFLILMGLIVALAYAPVNASGSKIIMPATQWKDSTSLVRGYSGTASPSVIVPVSTYPAASVPTTTFTDKDNGKTVTIAKDSIVKVQLEENPTTGFSWNTTVSSGIQVISSVYQPSGTGRFGAGGIHTWVIKVTGTGLQQLSGKYYRPWLQYSPDDSFDTYVLSFNVR